jgi:hypothetical protein
LRIISRKACRTNKPPQITASQNMVL